MSTIQKYSMPQLGSTQTASLIHYPSKEPLPEPKPRFVPIVPKLPALNDPVNVSGLSKSENIGSSSINSNATFDVNNRCGNIESPLKMKGVKVSKKSTKSHGKTPHNDGELTVANKNYETFKNYEHEKSIAPVKILPKNDSKATVQTQISPKVVQTDPPQISILDEAMEVCGISIENSTAHDNMVDGIMPIKGSVLKQAVQVQVTTSNVLTSEAPTISINQQPNYMLGGEEFVKRKNDNLKEQQCQNNVQNKEQISNVFDQGMFFKIRIL